MEIQIILKAASEKLKYRNTSTQKEVQEKYVTDSKKSNCIFKWLGKSMWAVKPRKQSDNEVSVFCLFPTLCKNISKSLKRPSTVS